MTCLISMNGTNRVIIPATITDIGDGPFFYAACQECYSKLVENPGFFWCWKCSRRLPSDQVQFRYRLNMTITDGSTFATVTAFGGMLNVFFGCSASELSKRWIDKLQSLFGSFEQSITKWAVEESLLGCRLHFGFKISSKSLSAPKSEGCCRFSLRDIQQQRDESRYFLPAEKNLIAVQVISQNDSQRPSPIIVHLQSVMSSFQNASVNDSMSMTGPRCVQVEKFIQNKYVRNRRVSNLSQTLSHYCVLPEECNSFLSSLGQTAMAFSCTDSIIDLDLSSKSNTSHLSKTNDVIRRSQSEKRINTNSVSSGWAEDTIDWEKSALLFDSPICCGDEAQELPRTDVDASSCLASSLPRTDIDVGSCLASSFPRTDIDVSSCFASSLPRTDIDVSSCLASSLPRTDIDVSSCLASSVLCDRVDLSDLADVSRVSSNLSGLDLDLCKSKAERKISPIQFHSFKGDREPHAVFQKQEHDDKCQISHGGHETVAPESKKSNSKRRSKEGKYLFLKKPSTCRTNTNQNSVSCHTTDRGSFLNTSLDPCFPHVTTNSTSHCSPQQLFNVNSPVFLDMPDSEDLELFLAAANYSANQCTEAHCNINTSIPFETPLCLRSEEKAKSIRNLPSSHLSHSKVKQSVQPPHHHHQVNNDASLNTCSIHYPKTIGHTPVVDAIEDREQERLQSQSNPDEGRMLVTSSSVPNDFGPETNVFERRFASGKKFGMSEKRCRTDGSLSSCLDLEPFHKIAQGSVYNKNSVSSSRCDSHVYCHQSSPAQREQCLLDESYDLFASQESLDSNVLDTFRKLTIEEKTLQSNNNNAVSMRVIETGNGEKGSNLTSTCHFNVLQDYNYQSETVGNQCPAWRDDSFDLFSTPSSKASERNGIPEDGQSMFGSGSTGIPRCIPRCNQNCLNADRNSVELFSSNSFELFSSEEEL